MNKKLIVLSIIALCVVNNNAKSYQGLEISKPFNNISNKSNVILDNVKQTSVQLSQFNNNNAVNDLVEKKMELKSSHKFTKHEKRQATKLIKNWVDNYLEKKNIKLFIANTKEKLDKYTKELNNKHPYNMAILNKMLIDSTLCDILKNAPQYENILRDKINYNILISLFALNAYKNKEVLKDITEELDKHNFNLQVFPTIVSIYNEANKKINEKLKEEKNTNKKQELKINNSNSFSIAGNEKEKYKFDDLKINKEQHLPKIKNKLSTLKDEDKNALLDDFSDVLESNDNIKINNQSVDQYFKLNNSLSTDQKLYDIIYSLVKIEMFSQIISLFNPFSSSISLVSAILTPISTLTYNIKPIVTISTQSYNSTPYYFGKYFGFGGFGYSFGSMFNTFMPRFGFKTLFINSFFGW